MSITIKELEEARKKLLNSQTVCGWCQEECKSTDGLIYHIRTEHKESKTPAETLGSMFGIEVDPH